MTKVLTQLTCLIKQLIKGKKVWKSGFVTVIILLSATVAGYAATGHTISLTSISEALTGSQIVTIEQEDKKEAVLAIKVPKQEDANSVQNVDKPPAPSNKSLPEDTPADTTLPADWDGNTVENYGTPKILTPGNDAALENGNVTVSWSKEGAPAYYIKVTDIVDNYVVVNFCIGKRTMYQVGSLRQGHKYKISVASGENHPDGIRKWAKDVFVTIGTGQVKVGKPLVTSPSNGSTVESGKDLTVRWNPVNGAESYSVYLKPLFPSSSPIFQANVGRSTFYNLLGMNLGKEGCEFQIYVVAIANGVEVWSDAVTLVTSSTLSIISPANGTRVPTGDILLEWKNSVSGAWNYRVLVWDFAGDHYTIVENVGANTKYIISSGYLKPGQYKLTISANGTTGVKDQTINFFVP